MVIYCLDSSANQLYFVWLYILLAYISWSPFDVQHKTFLIE